MAATLGVDTLVYFPWTVLNYMGIIFVIFLGFTRIGIKKIDEKEKEKFLIAEGEKVLF